MNQLPTIASPKPIRDFLWVASLSQIELAAHIRRVLDDASRLFGLSVEEMRGARRTAREVHARYYVAQRLLDETIITKTRVGKILNRDHTMVIQATTERKRCMVKAWLEANR